MVRGMLFIVYTTGRCNLNCSYCGGSFDPKIVPWSVEYSLNDLEGLIREEDVVAFYGGEPLLNQEFIKDFMDMFTVSRWVVQTNGLLLHRLEKSIIERFDAILVSIDGDSSLTDRFRGRGVYRRVLENVKKIREDGYTGDIIARMTITEESSIYRDVKHLLSTGLFNHIHWQISFIWTDPWKNLWNWIEENYKPGLLKLFNEWVDRLEDGVVDGIVPFQGVLRRMIYGGPAPPCGSGSESFTILTDGRIISCPIAVSEKWSQVGSIKETSRDYLENLRPHISEPCSICSYFKICGSRCLYTHIERLWGEEGIEAVCECSRYLIDLVEGSIEDIRGSALNGNLTLKEISYPEYNNTVEIIP
ncbi:MAG: TIGR04084 family radical SAM/SPASM domain-containing protein [Thaumarchaeota archaeon]|jgi:putative peptide-modifying radical SAM enzyme|nr:TIGR04084 family radical SAM/SPASM domain-containing protein [Candidatus Geocrenenecus arthurdayi]